MIRKETITADITLLHNFISKERCEQIIMLGEQQGFREAGVNVGMGRQRVIKGVRNNSRIMFDDIPLADQLWQLTKPNVHEQVGQMKACGLNERFRLYKYEQNQRFKMHRDGPYNRSQNEGSLFTWLPYLNDDITEDTLKLTFGSPHG